MTATHEWVVSADGSFKCVDIATGQEADPLHCIHLRVGSTGKIEMEFDENVCRFSDEARTRLRRGTEAGAEIVLRSGGK